MGVDKERIAYMRRLVLVLFFVMIGLFSSTGIALAANVSPSNISGSPGATVTLLINIDQPVANMTDWGLDINIDTTVLEYSSVDNVGTLSAPLVPSGIAKPFGARVGAYSSGGSATGPAGTLLKVNLKVKSNAHKNSAIHLGNFVDYVAGSTTDDSVFTITGMTVSVNLTPPSVNDVVAGNSVPLTAQVLVNGTPLELTSPDDIIFAASGRGAFGTKSAVDGDVVVSYTNPILIQSATISATETVTGNNRQDTSNVAGDVRCIFRYCLS